MLATSIAETSLTIEGVKIVVDGGYCRRLVYDPSNGLSHLETVRISKDMARQRAGRAGRVSPGVCYRLWTLATDHRMEEQRSPEICEADLTPMVLEAADFGETDVRSMPWLGQRKAGLQPVEGTQSHRFRRTHHEYRKADGRTALPSTHREDDAAGWEQ